MGHLGGRLSLLPSLPSYVNVRLSSLDQQRSEPEPLDKFDATLAKLAASGISVRIISPDAGALYWTEFLKLSVK